MTYTESTLDLSASLEDYLETIFQLVRKHKVARVKDIASARSVKPASVSPAMKRLGELGLIVYMRGEYISLTSEGETEARRVMARHRILKRFFEDVLRVPHGAAERDACAMEHSLSNEVMERLVRLFEFLQICPEGRTVFLEQFHHCPIINKGMPDCVHQCKLAGRTPVKKEKLPSVFDLSPVTLNYG